jgi:hypothetical protein
MKKIVCIILLLTCHAGYTQNVDSLTIAPNPFTTSTYIYYGLAGNDTVSLYVSNMFGQTVKTFMHDSLINSGNYSIFFPADSLPDGVYLVRLDLGIHKTIVKKAIKYYLSSVVENLPSTGNVLYPNPTSNLLTISINGYKTIVITDLAGKWCKTLKTSEKTISLNDLKPGSYIITVFSVDNILLSTEKVVKISPF